MHSVNSCGVPFLIKKHGWTSPNAALLHCSGGQQGAGARSVAAVPVLLASSAANSSQQQQQFLQAATAAAGWCARRV